MSSIERKICDSENNGDIYFNEILKIQSWWRIRCFTDIYIYIYINKNWKEKSLRNYEELWHWVKNDDERWI